MTRIEKAVATIAARVAREGSVYLYEREGMSSRAHHVIFVVSCELYRLGFYTVVRGDRIEVKRA